MTPVTIQAQRELNQAIHQAIFADLTVGVGMILTSPWQQTQPVPLWPEYCSDIAIAWRVVDRMKEWGFHFAIQSCAASDDHYHAAFWKGDSSEDPDLPHVKFGSVPETICRAALVAIADSKGPDHA